MIKYQISPYYKFLKPSQLTVTTTQTVEEIEQIKNGELFLLFNKYRNEKLLVNPVIYTFLSFCSRPISFNSLSKKLAEAFGEAPNDVKPLVEEFLESMMSKRIIFDAEHVKAIKNYLKNPNNVLHPLEKGTVMGQYVLTKLLSTHVPVEVHKAEDLKTNKPVILKLLRIEEGLEEDYKHDRVQNFLQEFRIMEELKGHPNICALEQYSDGDQIYGAMEFIEAISIRKRIQGIKPAPTLGKCLDWYAQTLDAFAYIHSKGLLHGDVHSSNILLRNDSEIKVIDFDMAFHADLREDEPPIHGGAFEFIAPEKINISAFAIAKEPADFHSEVYQLGLIGYFIFFGKLPFKGLTWEELAQKIIQNDIDFSTKNEEITPKMIVFLKKALQKEPSARFADASEMKANWAVVMSDAHESVVV